MRHNRTIIAFLNNQSFPEQEVLDHFPFPGIALTSSHDSLAQPVVAPFAEYSYLTCLLQKVRQGTPQITTFGINFTVGITS